MREWFLSILRCPYTASPLELKEDRLVGGDVSYPVIAGVPQMLDESVVLQIDQEFQRQYTEKEARAYDRAVRMLGLGLGVWEPVERNRMVNLLDLKPGARVLEVSVGTGANLPHIARRTGPQGEIVSLDLSVHMMDVARKRAQRLESPVHFCRGDAVFLPFAGEAFDAVFHFGGLNMFGDVRRSLAEMVRVVRPGGTVVVGDEGLAEPVRRSWLGRRLARMNSLFLCRPPFDQMPWAEVEGFELHWVCRQTFYLFKFRKRAGANMVQ